MKNDIFSDMRLVIIDSSGEADIVFSADDQSNKNTLHLSNNEGVEDIFTYYEEIKDGTYKKNDFRDKHLFYLKQHIKDKNIDIPGADHINDDLLLYYYMSSKGYVSIINSGEHVNIMISPTKGMSDKQQERLIGLEELFNNNTVFSYAGNMHIEKFEQDGKVYGTLDIGETIEGSYKSIIEKTITKTKAK